MAANGQADRCLLLLWEEVTSRVPFSRQSKNQTRSTGNNLVRITYIKHEKIKTLIESTIFETLVLTIIIASALSFGFRTFSLTPPLVGFLTFFDYAVTVFFAIEIGLRFTAEPIKRHFLKNGWNLFDTTIVALSLIPLPDGEYVLMARLLRIVRVLRLITVIPELKKIVEALITALPRLGYVAVLIFIVFYIYAVVGSLLFARTDQNLWGDLGLAMLTLFRVMTFEDWTDIMYVTLDVYAWSWLYYLSFILLVSFALLNMMIGVIVQSMEEQNNDNEDLSLERRLASIEVTVKRIEQKVGQDDTT